MEICGMLEGPCVHQGEENCDGCEDGCELMKVWLKYKDKSEKIEKECKKSEMTLEERNAIPDRERIKQYLENSIRQDCDTLTDMELSKDTIAGFESTIEMILKHSMIYKNMGFDRKKE